MKKVLILGSSHVGALKMGLDAIGAPSEYRIFYACLPGKHFYRFYLEGRRLSYPDELAAKLAITQNPRIDLCLHDFDKIIYAHGPCRLSLGLYTASPSIPLLSRSLVRDVALLPSPPSLFVDLMSVLEPNRLAYLGSPLVSESASCQSFHNLVPIVDSDVELLRARHLSGQIRDYCAQSLIDVSGPAFLLPPEHLLSMSGFNTLDQYIRGGVRFDGTFRRSGTDVDFAGDMEHGNFNYGLEIASILVAYIQNCA